MAKTLNIKWEKDKGQTQEEGGNNWDEPDQVDEREGRSHNHKKRRKRSKKRHMRLNIHGNSSVDSAFDSSLSNDLSQESVSPSKDTN